MSLRFARASEDHPNDRYARASARGEEASGWAA